MPGSEIAKSPPSVHIRSHQLTLDSPSTTNSMSQVVLNTLYRNIISTCHQLSPLHAAEADVGEIAKSQPSVHMRSHQLTLDAPSTPNSTSQIVFDTLHH